jgi:tetratricopeptide (TPR) repeat protein
MKKIYKTVLMILVVAISGITLSGCSVSDEKLSEYNQLVSDADILISTRDYTSAMEKLSQALEIVPSKIDSVERMVNIFVTKNRLDDALALIEESATKLNSEDKGKLYILVGKEAYNIGDISTSSYSFKLAEEVSNSKEILLWQAKISLQKGEIEKAKSLLDSNFEGDDYIESQLLLSYIQALNDGEKALSLIEDIEPGEQWRNAYSKWESILESLTEDSLFNGAKLAKQYIDVGYPYLAVSILEPLQDQMGEYTDGQYLLGKAYYEMAEYEKSKDILEESVSISDYTPYIYWILARDYYMLNNEKESFSYYDSAIANLGDEEVKELYLEYINLLLESNQTEKALEVMRVADRVSDESWVALTYLEIYQLREDEGKVEYYIENIKYDDLEDEEKREYLYSKGLYLLSNSDFDELTKLLDIFWELDEYDPRYNLLLAKLNFEEGNLDETRIYSKKAIEYDLDRLVTDEAQKLLAQID